MMPRVGRHDLLIGSAQRIMSCWQREYVLQAAKRRLKCQDPTLSQ